MGNSFLEISHKVLFFALANIQTILANYREDTKAVKQAAEALTGRSSLLRTVSPARVRSLNLSQIYRVPLSISK